MLDSDAIPSFALSTDSDTRLSVLDKLHTPMYLFDENIMGIVWANDKALDFWESSSAAELCSRDMKSGVSATVRQHLTEIKKNCFDHNSVSTERWTLYPNDKPKTVDISISAFKHIDGHELLLIQVLQSDQTLADEMLYRTTALMHTSTMISAYDQSRRLVYCNSAARKMIPDTCVMGHERLVRRQDARAILSLLSTHHSCDLEVQLHTTNGIRWHELHIERCTNPTSGKLMYLATETDITEQLAVKEYNHRLAFVDSLTNLPNRVSLMKQFDRLLGSDKPERFAVLFMDLDRFKNINDSLGHAVGDLLLSQVAERLTDVVRAESSVYRLAGDEFIILTTAEDVSTASSNVANRILACLAKHFYIGEHQVRIKTSIGIALYPEDANNGNALLEQADAAMYSAKASQCGYCFFDSRMSMTSTRDIKHRLGIERDLQKAVENDELELYYQPKISCTTMAVCGVEALVRWNHPDMGTLAPDRFISIAEESGQIIEMGDWVLHEAMQQQRRWQDQGLNIPVSINISAKQFESFELDIDIDKALKKYGCEPAMIELEVTESMLAGDPNGVYELLQRISALGIRLTLDDFGTGYSNLAYLQNYPLDSMKIDRLFLNDRKHSILLRTILNMGKTLGLELVAEGVETSAQADWLVEQGCDQMQGFYFSKPKPVSEITDYLTQHNIVSQSGCEDAARQRHKAANDEDHAA